MQHVPRAMVLLLIVLVIRLPASADDTNNRPAATKDPVYEQTITAQDSIRVAIHRLIDDAGRTLLTFYIDSIKKSVVLYDSARALAEAHFGHHDTSVARALTGLAKGLVNLDRSAEGFPMAEEALSIWETCVDKDDPKLGQPLLLVGDYHALQGRFTEPAEFYLRALSILEPDPEADLQTYANLKNNLGLISKYRFDYDGADSLLHQALNAWKQLYGQYSIWTAVAHGNLANLRFHQRRQNEADSLYRLALQILRQAGCPEFRDAGWFHSGLADIHVNRGEYRKASGQLHLALRIYEKYWGTDHPRIAELLASIIRLDWAMGNWQDGIAHSQRAVRLRENAQMIYYPDAGFYQTCLAESYCHAREYDKGIQLYGQSLAKRHKFVQDVFGYASEDMKMRQLRRNPLISYFLLAAAANHDTPRATEVAFQSVLDGKAVVLDAIAAERKIAYCSENVAVLENLNRLDSVCSQIAKLALSDNPDIPIDRANDSLRTLHKIRDRLETDISAQCHDFADELESRQIDVTKIARTLPESTMLWEFFKYWPYEFGKPGKRTWLASRYLCFTLSPNGTILKVDLGEADLIDSLIDRVHALMSDALGTVNRESESTAEQNLAEITSQLYSLIVDPLIKATVDIDHVFISPDRKLCLLPFEILVSPEHEYLIEQFSMSYLSSGRDLMRFGDRDEITADKAIVFASPDYDSGTISSSPPLLATLRDDNSVSRTRGPSDRTECLSVPFDRLPATAIEGSSIASLLSDASDISVDTYTGSAASETVLKNMQSPPLILHLATHGYFCSKASFSSSKLTENPLLYSGLALAGANKMILGQVSAEEEDGILTSLEASGLDLVGTELVVLSACQSGLGEVKSAEGVFGLRRAFQHAGARSILMSMFDVSDRTTAALMNLFYSNWLSGMSKAAALREASLELLNERRASNGSVAHPLFWSGFILTGDPN